MTKEKLEMIDFSGIPIPGQYDDLKGIELWGDGKVFRDGSKDGKKEKKVSSSVAEKIAKKTMKTPIFVQNESVLSYNEFVERYGELIDEESYKVIAETYEDGKKLYESSDDIFLYQFMESSGRNPFFTKWYPPILDAMKRPSTKTKIHKLLTIFINDNSDALSLRYPSKNIMIPSTMISEILNITGMSKEDTSTAVTELLSNLDAKSDFKSISKSPHQVVFTAMLMAAMELKEKQLENDMITFVAFTMYPLIFRKYFPVTDPNPQAMEEVVTTASKKFYISKTKSLLEWVRILTTVPTDFYKDRFEKPSKTDTLVISYLNRLRNTMNQQFKSLYKIYKQAYDNRSIGKQSDQDFITLGSNQDKVYIYTMSIMERINTSRFNAKICNAAAEYVRGDKTQIEKYVKEYLSDTKKYDLKSFISNILTLYYAIGQHKNFLEVAIHQYSRIFSSKDKMYNDFREYLERIEKKFMEYDDTYLHRYLYGVYMYLAILTNIGMNQISNKLADLSFNNSEKLGASNKQKEEKFEV